MLPTSVTRKQYVVSQSERSVALIENSISTNSDSVSVMLLVCDEVSLTPAFGVRKVMFSSVTPPVVVAMFVVLVPSVKLPESVISKEPPPAPTSVHEPILLQDVIFFPYSRRNWVDAEEVAPLLETSRRRRYISFLVTFEIEVSSTPPVKDPAVTSVPRSSRQ